MTLDELLYKLQALQADVRTRNDYAGDLVLHLEPDGRGWLNIDDRVYGDANEHYYLSWQTVGELAAKLDNALRARGIAT